MKKLGIVSSLAILIVVYLLGIFIINLFIDKDWETVLVKVNKREQGNFSTGVLSNFKYKYQFTVLKRDGFVGNIKTIYSNSILRENQVYGLELWAEERSSWFDYFLVPKVWADYTFTIDRIYNYDKDLKGIDFNKMPLEQLMEKVENEDKFFGSKVHND